MGLRLPDEYYPFTSNWFTFCTLFLLLVAKLLLAKGHFFFLTAVSVPLFAVLSGSAERFLFFSLVALIPFEDPFFLFNLHADHGGGAPGLYLVAADIPLLGLLVMGCYRNMILKNFQSRVPIGYLVFLFPFLVAALLSTIESPEPMWGLYELVRWGRVVLIITCVIFTVKQYNPHFILSCVALSLLFQSTLAVYQFLFKKGLESPTMPWLPWFRGTGTTVHPNIFGAYLILLLPIMFTVFHSRVSQVTKLVCAAVFVIGTGALFVTLSRGTVIAYAVAIVFALFFMYWKKIVSTRRMLIYAACGCFAAVLFVVVAMGPMKRRFMSDLKDSVRFRSDYNAVTYRMLRDNPALGVGINNFIPALRSYDPVRIAEMEMKEGFLVSVHNLYLLLLAETGIIGFLAFTLFIISIFVTRLRSAAEGSGIVNAVSLGIIAGLVGISVHNMAEFSLWNDTSLYTFALLSAFPCHSGQQG